MRSQRRATIVLAVAVSLVVVSAGVAFAWSKIDHRGMHYVAAVPGAQVVLTPDPDQLKEDMSGSFESASCRYRWGRLLVPFRAQTDPVDPGGWTAHVTVTVVNRPDGDDGRERDGGDGSTVFAESLDIAITGRTYSYANVRMDHDDWEAGANDCTFAWTVTPGAWVINDD